MGQRVNVLVSTFPGLGLPPTTVLSVPKDTTVSSVFESLRARIPLLSSLTVTTVSNKRLNPLSDSPISSFLPSPSDDFLTVRLAVPICGGKGGFGSQLRADGGRMSSRKKRPGVAENASSRNLDGRRIRSVVEAKTLAQYMISKPEMDRKAKEERKARLESIVDSAERKQAQILSGQNVRLDGQWIEDKDKGLETLREMILAKAEAGLEVERRSDQDGESSTNTDSKPQMSDGNSSSSDSPPPSKPTMTGPPATAVPKVFGWDDDLDEFMSSDDDSDTEPSEVSSDVPTKEKASS